MKLLPMSRRRSWWYVQPPPVYCIACDQCGGIALAWSEFWHLIWCYDCEIDTKGTEGIFDGPIPINLARSLGMSFDIFHPRLGRILYYHPRSNSYWSHSAKPS